jgi:hypothetical protein
MALRSTTEVFDTVTKRTIGVKNKTVTPGGNNYQRGRLTVGTSEETISVDTDIGDLGICSFVNHDATNFVSIGIATGSYMIELEPGHGDKIFAARALTEFFVLADTAAVELEYEFNER